MFKILSNKLICIALVVIIIINTFLPSVCYGDSKSALEIANDQARNEETGNKLLPYQDSQYSKPSVDDHTGYILMLITQDLKYEVNNTTDYESAREKIKVNRTILYEFAILLEELEASNWAVPETKADLFWDIVWNETDDSGNHIWFSYDYITCMKQQLGNGYGGALFTMLVYFNYMVENNINEYNGFSLEEVKTYLVDMKDSYKKSYNEYVSEYYDIDTNTFEKDDYGMYRINDNIPLKAKAYDELTNQVQGNENELDKENIPGYTEPIVNFTSNNLILGFLDYSMGIFIYIPKIIILVLPLLAQSVLSLFVSGGQEEWAWVSIEQILFNRLTITSINFFSSETVSGEMLGNNIVLKIREFIANWYYAFRNLVIVLYLCILIYIGIRMATSSLADDKAKYKTMLKNWVVGLGLTLVLHYIIIIVIQANNLLVSTISSREVNDNALMEKLFGQIFLLSFTTSFGSLILYSILVILTFIFFIIYLRRMITISFLVIVAPLITLTYPIDKAGDGKSQIINSWMREFISDVLIQFFHCVIYVVFVQTSMETLTGSGGSWSNLFSGSLNFAAITLSIVCTCSIFYAEKILKKLFGLDRGGTTFLKNLAMGAVLGRVIDNVKAIKGSKNDKQDVDVPDVMPDGEETLDAGQQLNNPQLNAKLAHQFGDNDEKNNSQENHKSSQTNKPVQKKTGAVQKGIEAYGRGLGALAQYTVPGYGAIKKHQKTKFNYKTKDVQKIFNETMERYSGTDENMTKEQFLLRMQALKNTDIEDIRGASDKNMKEWMMALETSYSNAGRINPEIFLDKSIDKFANEHDWKGHKSKYSKN